MGSIITMIKLADISSVVRFHALKHHFVDGADILIVIQFNGVGDNGIARQRIMSYNRTEGLMGESSEKAGEKH